jgi:DNA-directed RNA polymerase subunit M/transcription elongation factor TFIIS
MVVLQRFRDVLDAEAARGALAAAGIESVLADENVVGVAWTYSNAIGGIRLMVPEAQADEARELLGGDHASDLAHATGTTPEPALRCPKCSSADVYFETGRRRTAAFMLLMFLPWIWPDRNRCRGCGHAWKATRA